MDLSVVICSHNRYALLTEAASAIMESSSFEPHGMELIVVENTPREKRRALEVGKRCRVVMCDELGLSNARNAGIAASKGRIVAFVDDDTIVNDRWCAAVVDAFATHPDAAVCGGRTVPRYLSSLHPHWFYDELSYHLSCIDWGTKAQPIEPGQWIVGANMAFRRQVFERVGCFDPSLGRKGDASLLSNEENALLRKVGRANVYYIPSMVAEHIIPAERITLAWFRKRVFWQAVSDVLAGETFKSPAQAATEFFDIVSRAPAEYRGHQLLSYTPSSPQDLKVQLSAVYLQAVLMAQGMAFEAVKV